MKICTIENCTREHYAKGYCKPHYKRSLRGSDLSKPLRRDKEVHGMSGTPTYQTWTHMLSRCYNPKETGYKYWGGRGVTVCDKWRNSFITFYKDMGERPEGMSIDRINNNGNYEPSICRWATRQEQHANQRHGHRWQKEIMG